MSGRLTPAAHVILGMLGLGPKSGYDLKNFVEISTRHFWNISYGQIYPELRNLEAAGLVAAEKPAGGRRRTVYRLTETGADTLVRWLQDSSQPAFELRDELLLKLFFADRLPKGEAAELLESMRTRHEALLAGLRRTEQFARQRGGFPYRVLRFGIDFHEWMVGWCARTEKELEEGKDVREARAINQ